MKDQTYSFRHCKCKFSLSIFRLIYSDTLAVYLVFYSLEHCLDVCPVMAIVVSLLFCC